MHDLVWFATSGHEAHAFPGHPERPERLETILSALQSAGYWQAFPKVAALPLTQAVLQGVHKPEFLAVLEKVCLRGQHYDLDTYTTPASWGLALASAGGAARVAEAVWKREARRGFALTRPPGHHATADRAMGFCLLNNAAIAAEHLLQSAGAKRIAILDFDLHHGNGTQDIFYSREDVFYFSTHQSPLYPGSGHLTETGQGAGRGKTANFPLPPYSGDRALLAVTEQLILPLMSVYRPEIVLISYGFDPHWRDPLGSLLVTAQGYARVVDTVKQWCDEHCDGRIALILEGGYDLQAARDCTCAVTAALLGERYDQLVDPIGDQPSETETGDWTAMVQQAKVLWGIF